MKKYLSILLSLVILLMSVSVNADGENEPNMSVEVFPETLKNEMIESYNDEPKTEKFEAEVEYEQETNNAYDDYSSEQVELYASDDLWSSETALLEGRADFDTLVINNELYVVGGLGSSGYVYSIDKFNDNTLSWETVTSISDEIKGFSVVGVGNDIYIIGGYINNTYLNDIRIYNTITDTWTYGEPMLERRDKATSLYQDGKIYVFGGRNAKGLVDNYEYYDLESNAWYKVTSGYDESLIRIGSRGKYINGYVCIYGGYNSQYEKMGVALYTASDMNDVKQMTSNGSGHISIAWGLDKALIFASKSSNSATYSVSEMVINTDMTDIHSTSITDCPINAKDAQVVMYKGYLYCMGGYSSSLKKYNDTIYKYSVDYGDFVTGDGQIDSTVTVDGNTITLNVEANKDYYLMVNVNNMSTFEGYTFTIEYPEESFSLMDACALTDLMDRNIGTVSNSDIRITAKNSSGLSFTCSEEVPIGKKLSETVNVVWLRASSSGLRTITYRMTNN